MLDQILTFRGEIAALVAAFLWAMATVIFGRLGRHLVPSVLNFVKGCLAIAFILMTLWLRQAAPLGLEPGAVTLLMLSGVIGIGLGDTAYFAAVNRLGPRRALLMEALAPPMAAILAGFFLAEQLTLDAWIGIGLTLTGVGWVISERVPQVTGTGELPSFQSIGLGLLAAMGQATGAVLSRAALADTAVDPLWSTLLRLAAGVGTLLVLLLTVKQKQPLFKPLRSLRLLSAVAIAAFFGTYLAIWLQQTALKYAPTGVAQTLTATSPIFVLPIAALMGDRVSSRAVLGVGVAIVGIGLLFS
ncbi:MAG: DMT family transporter [Cyanobacteria bacterium P01_H01_bin.119]